MIVNSNLKNNDRYVGPRAIYDPNFIPPQLLFREKEEKTLSSILYDSISDDFSFNALYQGIIGIGKKVMISKVIDDISKHDKTSLNIKKFSIDCRDKNLEELLISLLAEMNKVLNLNISINSIINSDTSHLFSIFKLACKKYEGYLILIFNNIEYLKPGIFKKFLLYGKESNITIISTINNTRRIAALDLLSEFDIKKKLSFFSYNELNSILSARASLTFSHDIDKEMINFMTDLIFEHHVPVPGKGIDIFRELYPLLKEQNEIVQFEMSEICNSQFDFFNASDDFGMLTFISEEDISTILFLDNLANHFLKKSRYYITSNELKTLYDLSCETLECESNVDEFQEIIKTTSNVGILSPSKTSNLDCSSYFLVIGSYQLKAMVDVVFGKI
jgi:hypothetical protein